MPAPLPPNFSPRGDDATASPCVVAPHLPFMLVPYEAADRAFAESALDTLRRRFAADEAHLAVVMAKRSEAERIARRLADELARRGATEAEITAVIQEAIR
jgi:hypothetical protein